MDEICKNLGSSSPRFHSKNNNTMIFDSSKAAQKSWTKFENFDMSVYFNTRLLFQGLPALFSRQSLRSSLGSTKEFDEIWKLWVDFPSTPAKQSAANSYSNPKWGKHTQRRHNASKRLINKRTQIKIAYHCGVSTIIAITFTETEEKE